MASINTGTSDHIISVSVPTSQKGSSTECTVGEVYNAEELRAKYGLDAVVRTNDTPESKHIDFDTMTLEDFTETKACDLQPLSYCSIEMYCLDCASLSTFVGTSCG